MASAFRRKVAGPDSIGGSASGQIVALIGAGGMGEVYRAREIRLGQRVAIKLPDI